MELGPIRNTCTTGTRMMFLRTRTVAATAARNSRTRSKVGVSATYCTKAGTNTNICNPNIVINF